MCVWKTPISFIMTITSPLTNLNETSYIISVMSISMSLLSLRYLRVSLYICVCLLSLLTYFDKILCNKTNLTSMQVLLNSFLAQCKITTWEELKIFVLLFVLWQ
jgi:hypothetical protein